MMKKITTIALLLAMLVTAMASCGGGDTGANSGTPSNDTTAAEETTTAAEETTAAINWKSANLPEKKYDGYNYRFLEGMPSYELTVVPWYIMVAEEENGEVLNDAVYERNRTIEEAFDVKITVNYADKAATATTNAKNAILAGDDAFDAIFNTQGQMHGLVTNKMLLNLHDLDYINLDQPWWDQSIVRDLTVKDQLYYATGDINPSMDFRAFAMVFNKDLADKLGAEYPYKKVLDGQWTREYFESYVKGINADVNGDGQMDFNDRWGYLGETTAACFFYHSWGGYASEYDADGNLVSKLGEAKNLEKLQAAMEILTDKEVTAWGDTLADQESWTAVSAWYMEGNALVRSSTFEAVPRDYRLSETDFGVLPFPKYDEAQEEYITLAAESGYVVALPLTSTDTERASIILEALAAESTNTVKTAAYDVCLNGKYIRDEESEEMLDIIFGNKIYDIAYMVSLGGYRKGVVAQVKAYSTDVASFVASIESQMATALGDYMKVFTE